MQANRSKDTDGKNLGAAHTVKTMPWLDVLRAVAAWLVVFGHVRGTHFVEYGALTPESKNPVVALFYFLTRWGHEAVMIFFVLSGFLVGGRALQKSMSGTFDFRGYLIDRTTRIFVPLLPALLLTGIFAVIRGYPFGFKSFLINLAGFQGVFGNSYHGNNPLWSLSYEIWFYGLGAFVFWMISRSVVRTGDRLFPWLLFLAGLFVFTVLDTQYLLIWCLGALFYFVPGPERPQIWMMLMGAGVFGFACFWHQLTSETKFFALPQALNFITEYRRTAEVAVALSGCLLIILLRNREVATPIERGTVKVGKLLADSSYSVYLCHMPVITFLMHLFPGKKSNMDFNSISLFALKMAVIFVFCQMFWFCFERNTSKIRNLIRRRLK